MCSTDDRRNPGKNPVRMKRKYEADLTGWTNRDDTIKNMVDLKRNPNLPLI